VLFCTNGDSAGCIPGNILIAGDLTPKIADFGSIRTMCDLFKTSAAPPVASHDGRCEAASISMTTGVGTPLYMVCEQAGNGCLARSLGKDHTCVDGADRNCPPARA
jgi:hypothetical protein